ncbi:LTP_2 domain-containing protein [Cephalotus follicularis]|uniref:LTP_2 domain-containing protein n=2 Tax=Cephalotus follicularis TaxID=3775 RepID=A0A1Q3C5A4_CEPFO|nr:LTP_2 domain-containing protein [Cephalotus follicularis]
MSIPVTRCLIMAMVVVVGTLIFCDHGANAQCSEIPPIDLMFQCERFVQISGPKIPPSRECCSVVKKVEVPCICKVVTPEIEKIISMDKVVYVARTCGVPVQPGMKCGSKIYIYAY